MLGASLFVLHRHAANMMRDMKIQRPSIKRVAKCMNACSSMVRSYTYRTRAWSHKARNGEPSLRAQRLHMSAGYGLRQEKLACGPTLDTPGAGCQDMPTAVRAARPHGRTNGRVIGERAFHRGYQYRLPRW